MHLISETRWKYIFFFSFYPENLLYHNITFKIPLEFLLFLKLVSAAAIHLCYFFQ